ncbi:hypothetical protein C8J57DRAFT_1087134 [Mycena rebaudengoi]|nr:hypothetical protein C8J57DRAFT_1087134 [Mycena rebaudengoi]
MAAPRIAYEPALEIAPNFGAASYQAIRAAIVSADNISDAQAATKLLDIWTTDLDVRKAQWATQVQDDADQAAAAAATAAQDVEDALLAEEARLEAEKQEADKKRAKFPAFDASLTAPDFLQPRVANFAKEKVLALGYVDLWYWTIEGCKDSETLRSGTAAEDTYTFSQANDGPGVELKAASSSKASKKVILDEDLTWEQMSVASMGLLKEMEVALWDEKYRQAFASFYYALQNHPYVRRGEPGKAVLLIYQARVRRNFHDILKEGRTPFNIALINTVLLDSIQTEFNQKQHTDKMSMVRFSSLSLFYLRVLI